MDISKQYDVLVEAIIRPPRAEYELEDLGDPDIKLGARTFHRDDFELTNPRGLKFFCSMYAPVVRPRRLPCVIFCHGNGGCRLDATETLRTLLPMNIMVVTLDFSGCGRSEGEYISLGYFEKEDVNVLVNHLRELDVTTRIALWGRSMGAVIAIQSAHADPSLACIVADSPFSTLQTLANELVSHFDVNIPGLMVKLVFKMVRNSVKKRAKFDVKKLDNLKAAQEAFVPALFGHGDEDDFIAPSHTVALQAVYAGDSNKVIFGGDHNSNRPPFFLSSVSIFFRNHLLIPTDFGDHNPLPNGQTLEEYFAVVGGGDSMRLFQPVQRRAARADFDDDDSDDFDSDIPVAVPRRAVSPTTEEEMIQRAIAASLAEGNSSGGVPVGSDDDDPDLAAALALSAAEAKKEQDAAATHGKGSSGSDKKPSSNGHHTSTSRPGTPKEASGEVATSPRKERKEKEKEKEKEKKKQKGKDDKEKRKSHPVLDIHELQLVDSSEDSDDSPPVATSPKKDKKHKDKHGASSGLTAPAASSKKKDKSGAKSPKAPLSPTMSHSGSTELDSQTIGLDNSDEDDEELQRALRLSAAAASTPPRNKKK